VKSLALQNLREVASSPDEARALPAECYRDPDFYLEELERVMRPEWHAVARADQLPNSGDYRAVDIYGEPILLVRDAELRLRAYSGVCLHRAFPFADGEGNAKRFVCPYHRWAYDLDGRLCAAPLMENTKGFDRDSQRLPELALEEWQGFVLVNTDSQAAPLGPRLASLSEKLTAFNYADLRTIGVLEYDSPWNWKVMVENFMESYHHLGPHVDNLQRSNPAAGTHAEKLDGPCSVIENPPSGAADPLWVGIVFPDLLFSLSRAEEPYGVWYEMQVDGPAHFRLRIHALASEALAANDAFREGFSAALDEIHQQDIEVCLGIQRGLESRLWRPGRLNAVHEETMWKFHRYLADQMLGL
jgi:phenylpropionate dioxygenase-like ring-hydroxylating dioxygenase large terminal subunit